MLFWRLRKFFDKNELAFTRSSGSPKFSGGLHAGHTEILSNTTFFCDLLSSFFRNGDGYIILGTDNTRRGKLEKFPKKEKKDGGRDT